MQHYSHPLSSTHSATLLNLPLFCSLNETLCKFQVTTVISIISSQPSPSPTPPPPQLDPLPLTAQRSLLLPCLLSFLALMFSTAFPSPLLGPGFFSTVSNPSPTSASTLSLSPWLPEPTLHQPPAQPGGNPRVLLPPFVLGGPQAGYPWDTP